RPARHWLDQRSVRLKSKTSVPQPHFALEMRTADRAAAGRSGGHVNPIVNAPARVADARPDFADAEACEQFLAQGRFALAVAIRQIEDVRGADGDHAVTCRHHTVARRQVVGEDCRPDPLSVVAGVVQQADRAIGLLFRPFLRLLAGRDAANGLVEYAGIIQFEDVVIAVAVVAVQLADVDASARIETHPGRFSQLRLSGDEFDSEALRQMEALAARFWRERLGSICGRRDLLSW